MQTQKKPAEKKANSKSSAKVKGVEEENILKKQGIKVQFEDLKKQVEKFKIDPSKPKEDADTPTTNTQTLIFSDKNAIGDTDAKNVPKNTLKKDSIMKDTIQTTNKELEAATASLKPRRQLEDDPENQSTVTASTKPRRQLEDDPENKSTVTASTKPRRQLEDDPENKINVTSKEKVNDEPKKVVTEEPKRVTEITKPINSEKEITPVEAKQTITINEEVKTPKERTHEDAKKELKEETELIDAETKRIKSIEAQKQARREAIKNLFEATGGNIPAMFNEVNKELKDLMKTDKILKLDNINFSDDLKSFRTPTFANSYDLDSATDFFGMKIEDQELLFDRIGLFKGVVVDYSKENPIEQGYRDVVKHLIRDKENDDKRSKPVRVFYKKPRLSGFYETNYAFDEYQKKSQESGVFNLGFGLSASYNKGFVSAGVKAGYSYSKESLAEKSTHIKEISIISSFFLPKIELSFDTLQSCAADDLIAYLEQALENEQDTIACFDRINTILMSYGQFVPTSLVIGARLYSSDTKKIKQEETVENVLTKHAAEFKAAVSTMVFEAGIEVKTNSTKSSKTHEQSTSEAQNIQFNAIGGEGAFVANMEKWVASTGDSKGWGLVRFDNLVPVIDVLPAELQKRITALFNRVVEECTIEDLLNKSAQFLFHKGYFERFGSKAQPKFCIIKNSISGKLVLSVKINGELENNQEVTMSAYDGEGGEIQEWYFANSGKIYLKSNYDTENKFVLSINTSTQPHKLVITQDNYFDNQHWDARGGMIQCLNNSSFITYDGDKVQLEARDKAKNNTWLLVPEKEINAPSRRRIEAVRKNNLMLLDVISDTLDNNYYLPLNGTLKSQNGYAQLKFSADKIVILWGKGQKEIWNHSITKPGASKLGITNGTFAILDEKDNILEEIATNIVDIRLMDSGNIEAIDQDNNINWETSSIIYAYIQSEITKVALSIMVLLNEYGRSEFKYINSQPYAGGDHQLWYINRKNNIVSKYTDNMQKFALTEITTESPNPSYYNNPSANSPTTKSFHAELAILNTANAKGQQWGGLVPNRKGSIQNQVSKAILEKGGNTRFGFTTPISDPNEKWELIFDENAKQEANIPNVNFTRGGGKINKNLLYSNQLKLALRDIPIKAQDIRAVCFEIDGNDDTLSLKFRNHYGTDIRAETVLPATYVSYGLRFPSLSSAIYFSDDQTHLSLIEKEVEKYSYHFEFQTMAGGRILNHSRLSGDSIYTYPNNDNFDINTDWVYIPENHKAIGIAFVVYDRTIITPCLISVKR